MLNPNLNVDNLPIQPPAFDSSELAILCEPGNVEHIITAILFLIQNPQWSKKLGENAKTEALNKYTWNNHVSVILDHLRAMEIIC